MKKLINKPEVRVVLFAAQDVIATSQTPANAPTDTYNVYQGRENDGLAPTRNSLWN